MPERPILAYWIALWVLLLPQAAWSLGLSEVEVESALNEKFAATIDLLDARGLQEDEIIVSMASREDFERVGVERFFYLTDIQFEVDLSGTPKVVLSSRQPISEPYLNFIVEVLWPKGRLLKEYTVLLDPPTFTQAAAPPVQAPARATEPSTTPSRPTQSSPSRAGGDRIAVAPSGGTPSAQPSDYQPGDRLLTTRDDTLWKIASRTLPSNRVTVNQQMIAIQKINPEAFIQDNINLLKAGYELEIPSESEALALNDSAALAEVREQTQEWRNPGSPQVAQNETSPLRGQVDGTTTSTPQTAAAGSEQGQVRIVANAGDLSQGSASGADAEAAELLESNETLNRRVDELSYELDREKELAASQIELKDRQLEVANQKLAELQQQMTQMRDEFNQMRQNQNQNTAPAAAAELPWWQSPMVLGGVIGVLVLALAALLFSNRRRDDDYVEYSAEDFESEPTVAAAGVAAVGAVAAAEVEDEADDALEATEDAVAIEEDLQDEILSLDEDETEDAESPGDGVASADVIGEADIYIAYGRHGQAISLLTGALQTEPERHDVRLKLLEACVEAEDPSQFAEHAEYLVNHCDDPDILMATRELEARLSDQVATLDDLDSGDASGDAEDALALDDLPSAEASDDETLSLDDDALADAASDDGDDDFELEFDEPDAAMDAVQTNISEDLGGDLGLEFNPDADASADESAEVNEDDFDVDDLLGEATDEAASESAGASADGGGEDDFDFGSEGETDINTTKLDLAEAYIDMGDADGARDILREVVDEGTADQADKAKALLESIG